VGEHWEVKSKLEREMTEMKSVTLIKLLTSQQMTYAMTQLWAAVDVDVDVNDVRTTTAVAEDGNDVDDAIISSSLSPSSRSH